jgi:AcrR family transcriptional regulator
MNTATAKPPSEEPTPRKRPGGRTARVGGAVLEATLELLAEGGFSSLTIDRVADRSGVHKTTIYRRWGSREGLVGAALAGQSASQVPIPDTGSLRGDVTEIARSVAANLTSPLGRALARAIIGHADDPEIGRISDDFWRSRFDRTAVVVDRAVTRGELAQRTDPRLVVELVVATVWFRSIAARAPIDDELIASVVDIVLSGFDRHVHV